MRASISVQSLIFAGMLIMLSGCGDRSAKERVAAERTRWEESLNDSVSATTRSIDSLKNRLSELRETTDHLLSSFRTIDNPKEVEKYYQPEVAGYVYPLSETGLGTRLMANEQLELIAVMKGSRFTAIEIEAGGKLYKTHEVAPDQALNYRIGDMTTVSFSGKDIDSIAPELAESAGSIRVIYLDQNRKVGEKLLPESQREALILACRLATARRETILSEKRLGLLNHKLSIIKNRQEILEGEK